MSERKAQSNRNNALRSTGPKTPQGKARSSQNSSRHGLLSRNLIIDGESQSDFDALCAQLHEELSPVGTLEMAMVERIAIAYWRQRRLVAAEAATIQLQQKHLSYNALQNVRALAGVSASYDDWIRSLALEAPDLEEITVAVSEMEACPDNVSLATFRTQCPQSWVDLCTDAANETDSDDEALASETAREAQIAQYLEDSGSSLPEWMAATCQHYRKLSGIIRALQVVQQAQTLPQGAEVLARYQSALDNDVYKAVRALREAQKHRLELAALNAKVVVQGKD